MEVEKEMQIEILDSNVWSRIEDSKKVFRNFVSPLTGIIARVVRQMHEVDDIRCHAVGATSANSSYTTGNPTNTLNGGGGGSEDGTYLAAVGEGIERYCVTYLPDSVKCATYSQISSDEQCLGPQEIGFFSREQYELEGFPFKRFDPDVPIAWTTGVDLRTGASIQLPAQMIYMSSWDGFVPEPQRITYATSNGLSAHLTRSEACLSSLFEVLERDAFMAVWYSKISMPTIPHDLNEGLSKFIERHISPAGLEFHLVNLSEINEIPTVMAIVINCKTKLARFAIGAAAAATLEIACKKALVEAFQTRIWVKAEQRSSSTLPSDCDWGEKIRVFDDHIRLYADDSSEHLREEISFLYEGQSVDEDYFRWDLHQGGACRSDQ